jgi:PhzF family phenazine biosynthesis protein
MAATSFALYDSFSDRIFGGSQAAVISEAAAIDRDTRHAIAREIGFPATAFVDACGDDWLEAQFMSAVMELPMCGHGTICLLTHLFENGLFHLDDNRSRSLRLRLPGREATVEVCRGDDERFRVLLDIEPAQFEAAPTRTAELLQSLGLDSGSLCRDLPLEKARGDFIHLVVPLSGLDAMARIKPDFEAIVSFCHLHGIETVALFCTEVDNPGNTLHVRDFCPAVGVSESAAAGTTNAALASYLVRHRLVPLNRRRITVIAEQGIELGRPSSIQSNVTLVDGKIVRLQVGGVATRVMDGRLYLRDSDDVRPG